MLNPEQYDNAAQAVLDEPVVACGPCTRTLGLSGLALSQVSGAAGLIQSARGKSKAGGLPQAFLVAVTADQIHLLSQPKVRWNPKPKAAGVISSFPLATTRIETASATLGTKIVLHVEGGEQPLEIQTVKGDAGERLVRTLVAAASVAPPQAPAPASAA